MITYRFRWLGEKGTCVSTGGSRGCLEPDLSSGIARGMRMIRFSTVRVGACILDRMGRPGQHEVTAQRQVLGQTRLPFAG
jgi:hypothetical protein